MCFSVHMDTRCVATDNARPTPLHTCPCYDGSDPESLRRTDIGGRREAEAADETGAQVADDVAVQVRHAQHVELRRVAHLPSESDMVARISSHVVQLAKPRSWADFDNNQ